MKLFWRIFLVRILSNIFMATFSVVEKVSKSCCAKSEKQETQIYYLKIVYIYEINL